MVALSIVYVESVMFSFKNAAILPRKFENIFTINNRPNPLLPYKTCKLISFVYHCVEQISGNSLYSIEVLNFLSLFHLKFLALYIIINSVIIYLN